MKLIFFRMFQVQRRNNFYRRGSIILVSPVLQGGESGVNIKRDEEAKTSRAENGQVESDLSFFSYIHIFLIFV